MNELFREIEEDIRRERVEKLWNSFGKVMVVASLAVILGTVVIVIMQNRKESHAMERTTQFIKGVDRINIEDYKGAVDTFGTLAADKDSTYYDLAMLRKAQAEKARGDQEAAAATYGQIASDPVLGGLAALQAGSGEIRLPSKDSPFYYTQTEWRGWQLMEGGKKDEAITLFTELRDDMMAPMTQRQRLAEVLQHMSPPKPSEAMAQTKGLSDE